jgi:hypothetical protein
MNLIAANLDRVAARSESLPGGLKRLGQLLRRGLEHTADELSLAEDPRHFLKVTKSYWPGLFACHGSPDPPRTINELEHAFGSHRYRERRTSGRGRVSPGLVAMSSTWVISSLATRLRTEEGLVLRPS